MKTILSVVAFLVTRSVAVLGPGAPPASSIQIGEISYSGTGCPQGTASFILSAAKDIVTFGFDKFQATIGPQSPPGDSRKKCNIRLQLQYSDGYQMSVEETVYHGYTRLDDGVNAKFTTEYDYLNNPNPGKRGHAETSVDGEKDDGKGKRQRNGKKKSKQFQKNHKHKGGNVPDDGAWSKCGQDAHLLVENNLVLTTKNKTASGEFQIDDETIKFEQKLAITYRQCK